MIQPYMYNAILQKCYNRTCKMPSYKYDTTLHVTCYLTKIDNLTCKMQSEKIWYSHTCNMLSYKYDKTLHVTCSLTKINNLTCKHYLTQIKQPYMYYMMRSKKTWYNHSSTMLSYKNDRAIYVRCYLTNMIQPYM